jgi:hypothetical protein
MATSLQLAVGDPPLMAAVRRCRSLLHRRAIAGAAVSALPIPGLDWLVDAALLSNLLPPISDDA